MCGVCGRELWGPVRCDWVIEYLSTQMRTSIIYRRIPPVGCACPAPESLGAYADARFKYILSNTISLGFVEKPAGTSVATYLK